MSTSANSGIFTEKLVALSARQGDAGRSNTFCESASRASCPGDAGLLGREGDLDLSAATDFAPHMDRAFVGFDDRLALKHSDAETFGFGAAEGAEEGALDKVCRHSDAVVFDVQDPRVLRFSS